MQEKHGKAVLNDEIHRIKMFDKPCHTCHPKAGSKAVRKTGVLKASDLRAMKDLMQAEGPGDCGWLEH